MARMRGEEGEADPIVDRRSVDYKVALRYANRRFCNL